MLEYFTSKMGKKPQVETKERSDSPILSPKDEQFLEHIVSEDRAVSELNTAPEMREAGDAFDNPAQILGPKTRVDDDVETTRGKGHHHSSSQGSKNRWSILDRFNSKKSKSHHDHDHHHSKDKGTVTSKEANREEDDLSAVLEKLNLAADNNKVFSLSKESRELVRKFTLVLQDLVNGVPTAYDDLVHLLDDSQNQLEKSYKHLPPYLQKLIRSLPKKLTTTMGPEILATAAETQGLSSSEASDMKYAAKKTGVRMPSLKDMVTKPGAVAGILRAIMNFLKLRWPAFMGTSVLWSLGIFVLLLVFWYCHKRGREVRLAKEKAEAGLIDDADRFEELDDDDEDDMSVDDARVQRSSSRRHRDHGHHSDHHRDRDHRDHHRHHDSHGDRDRDDRRTHSGSSRRSKRESRSEV